MKLLFCDIDGTLTETISGATFKQHPNDVKVIEGAREAIAYFQSQGWTIVGISNQGGCSAINPATGKPHKSIEDAVNEMQFTLSLLPQIECILLCPDFEGNQLVYVDEEKHIELSRTFEDSYRKPGIGMIQYIRLNIAPLGDKVEECIMVGDRPEDQQCAANAGIKFIAADIWRNQYSVASI